MAPNKPIKNRKVVKYKSKSKFSLITGIIALIVILVVVVAIISAYLSDANLESSIYSDSSTKVLLHTTAGDIVIQLRNDKPITTANFINIVKNGWYDNTTFHRVISGFMIQGGDIEVNGHSVAAIADEIGENNRNLPYTVAMAKISLPNSATSQFFINVADNGKNSNNPTFDATYTVFGRVISGKEVVDAIANAQVTQSSYGEMSQPVNPVVIISASIVS